MKTRNNTNLALVAPLVTKRRCVDPADKLCIMFGSFTFETVTKMTVVKAPKKRRVAKKSQFSKKRRVAKKPTVKLILDQVDEFCLIFSRM